MGWGERAIVAVLAIGLVASIIERIQLSHRRAQRESRIR